jgi:TonB family protein
LDEQHPWGTAVLTLYLGVSLVLLMRLVAGAIRMGRIKSKALPLRESWTLTLDVRIAREICGPVTFGATILLPACHASWTQDKRTMILSHEAAHVRHHDSQVQWLAAAHVALFWFSPLAWWLRRRLAQLAEYASDDAVLRGNTQNIDYARVLLEEARARSTQLIATGIGSCAIEQRVDRILRGDHPMSPPSIYRRTLAVMSVIPILALAADAVAVKATHPNSPSQSANLFGMNDSHPFIIAGPSGNDLRKYYPPEARRKGINGLVQIRVTLDGTGRATDTLILSETPVGLGFGAAASELAHKFRYLNQTGHPAPVTYRMKFELDDSGKQARPGKTDTNS